MTGKRNLTRRKWLNTPAYAIVLGVLFSWQPAVAVTLDIDLLSPTPVITDADSIDLRAFTSHEVLPDTAWKTETTSLVISGFDIDWEMASHREPGIGLQIIIRAGDVQTIGPLPVGTYNVTASWLGQAPIWYTGPLPLVGTTQFTVIPEPTALALMAGGLSLLVVRRSR